MHKNIREEGKHSRVSLVMRKKEDNEGHAKQFVWRFEDVLKKKLSGFLELYFSQKFHRFILLHIYGACVKKKRVLLKKVSA